MEQEAQEPQARSSSSGSGGAGGNFEFASGAGGGAGGAIAAQGSAGGGGGVALVMVDASEPDPPDDLQIGVTVGSGVPGVTPVAFLAVVEVIDSAGEKRYEIVGSNGLTDKRRAALLAALA